MPRLFFVFLMTLGLIAQSRAAVEQAFEIPLPGKKSILHMAVEPDPVTETGRRIARILYDGLLQHDPKRVADAMGQLEGVAGKENVGGSYTALLWLAREWMATQSPPPGERPALPPMDQAYRDYFLSDDAKYLREYLQRKYAVADFEVKDPEAHLERRLFLEDYLIFNSPTRREWEVTDAVVDLIRGMKSDVKRVLDVGSGFGYFSHRFVEALGEGTTVYAVDTQETYINRLREVIDQYGIEGIKPSLSTSADVGVKEETDMAFIASLYHVFYIWTQKKDRDQLIDSIRRSLRPDGYLVVLDNRDDPTSNSSLHNFYLDPNLAIAQLYFHGFELVRQEVLSPLRYVLVFRKKDPGSVTPPVFPNPTGQPTIRVTDANSVVHIGSLDSFDITPAGTAAAKLMLKALSDSDMEAARAAISLYDKIIPNENFGGEYTALQWVAEYLVGSEEEKKALIREPLAAEYLAYLSKDDYAYLKDYIGQKYKLEPSKMVLKDPMSEKDRAPDETGEKAREIGLIRRKALEDFILFNNPKRETWEKSSRILELVPIKPGDRVVDIGSGPGFFTFKFAERVGPEGFVHAMDTKDTHVDYIKTLASKWGLNQVSASLSERDGFEIEQPGTADLVFMCSLYHILYAVSSQAERDGMIASIIKALKPGGHFVLVDNGPVEEGTLPYHGPNIRQELIKTQLEAHGFRFESSEQITPQRYLMVFSHGVAAD